MRAAALACLVAAPARAAESEDGGWITIVVALIAALGSVAVAYLGLRQASAAKSKAQETSNALADFKAKLAQIIVNDPAILEAIKKQAELLSQDEVEKLVRTTLMTVEIKTWRERGLAGKADVDLARRNGERLVKKLEENKVRPLEENVVDLATALEHLQIAISPDQLADSAMAAAARRMESVRRRRRPT